MNEPISEVTGKAPCREQLEAVMEDQVLPTTGLQQCLEGQGQAPHLAWESHQQSEAAPWGDAKAFLASFEQVAAACGWPRGEWVARLLPALSGGARQAFNLLENSDREDYGKMKAAILRGEVLKREKQRQHFRQFCCPQLGDPRRMYSQVQELCCQWLKPERHSKEQILDLLVLEQFLAGLPGDAQSWVRACGPDSGEQAVALLENFILSHKEADMLNWKEPLQEWAVDPLDVKEKPMDMMQGEVSKEHTEIFRDTQQEVDGEVALPGLGLTHPTLLLSPECQDMTEAELSKVLGIRVVQVSSPIKPGGTLHMVDQTTMQSHQQPMVWKVLQDSDNVDSMDGGDGTQLLVMNSQFVGNKPVKTPKKRRGKTQKNASAAVEMEKGFEYISKQGTELHMGCKESGELLKVLGDAPTNSRAMDTEGEMASFSNYGRSYHPMSGLVSEHSRIGCIEGPSLGENIHTGSYSDQQQRSYMEEQNHNCPKLGLMLQSNSLANDQIVQPAKNTYKSFSPRPDFLMGKTPYQCSDCGKCFSLRSGFLAHQMLHTGEKPHKCPDCRKSFYHRGDFLTHQMIHQVKKPVYGCSTCDKSFSRKSNLLRHQKLHTEEKLHQCPTCGKSFNRSDFLAHQVTHPGKKPYQCPECGKGFDWKTSLARHQHIHTKKKVHNAIVRILDGEKSISA